MNGFAMKRCARCHGKLGLGVRSRNVIRSPREACTSAETTRIIVACLWLTKRPLESRSGLLERRQWPAEVRALTVEAVASSPRRGSKINAPSVSWQNAATVLSARSCRPGLPPGFVQSSSLMPAEAASRLKFSTSAGSIEPPSPIAPSSFGSSWRALKKAAPFSERAS